MQNNNKLIGTIDPQAQLSLRVSQRHFSDLELLAQYGWVGNGFRQILGNRHINEILKTSGVDELAIDGEGVHGLEKVPEGERHVLEELLLGRYERSERLVKAVNQGDFNTLDAINMGVVKGLGLAIVVSGSFEAIGLRNTWTEMASRFFPGIFESAQVSHQVGKEDKSQHGMSLAQKIKSNVADVLSEFYFIGKSTPGDLYDAADIGHWIEKVRGKLPHKRANSLLEDKFVIEEAGNNKTYTHIWATGQKSAPYRGAAGILILRPLRPYIPSWLYNLLDPVSVFWVNSGNNAQGVASVFGNIYRGLKDKLPYTRERAQESFKRLVSDPFQLSNLIVCSIWISGVLALRSYGIRLEEHLGNFGAALEASIIGFDTAVAAQFAKGITYYKFSVQPYLNASNPNLFQLARKYDAGQLKDSLEHDYTPTGFVTYRGGQLTLNTYQAIGTIAEKANKGMAAIGHFLQRTLI